MPFYSPVKGFSFWVVFLILSARETSYRGQQASRAGRVLLSLGCSLLTGAAGTVFGVVFCFLVVLSRAQQAIDSKIGQPDSIPAGGG